MPLTHPRAPRRLNSKKVWRPRFATEVRPPSAEALIYAQCRAATPEPIAVEYGVDARGPWARVGDMTARARTAAAALTVALNKHMGAT